MNKEKETWICRMAPSLGDLESSNYDIWGTFPYDYQYLIFKEKLMYPCVFFGLYGFPDFCKLWHHKGRKFILWAGSDIKHFINGYWLDDKGGIRLDPTALAEWINKNCESYVENGVEHEALMVLGIESKIVPSFLGKIENYEVSYTANERPQVYVSVSGNNFADYGWERIEMIADRCNVDFHLFGNTTQWESKHSNVFVHGRMPKEKMNEMIKNMQCGLRLNEFDGFSEILAKSVLWAQHPISFIGYPHIDSFKTNDELVQLLNKLANKGAPNIVARDYYIKNLNKYPWVS